MPPEPDIVIFYGCAKKDFGHPCFRSALSDLGFDVSGHSFRHSIYSTVPDGRCALLSRRRHPVRHRLGPGARGTAWVNWKSALAVGACLILVGNGGVTISEKFIPSGLASLIVATVPIHMVLLGWLSGMSPRPQPIVWLGLIAGFCGVAVLLGSASTTRVTALQSANRPFIGMSILLCSSFIWSVGSLYSRRATHRSASPFLAAAQQMLCGGVLLFVLGVLTGELREFHPGAVRTVSVIAFIYLVLIGAVVGFTAYIWLLHHCD